MRLAVAAALSVAACASAPATPAGAFRDDPSRDHVGRIWSYERTNRDGSLPEQVHVFQRGRDDVHVYKMVSRCTNAAYVTARLDRGIWSADRLVGGRLRPDATQDAFAVLTLDRSTRVLDAVVTLPGQTITERETLTSLPWRLYDFDFADFTVLSQHLSDFRRDFSFTVALVLTQPDETGFLTDLGVATAVYDGIDRARDAYRYRLEGPPFPGGGALLLDRTDGHVVEASSARPNHAEYDDFKLTLKSVNDGGEAAWRALLLSHFEGCDE